MAEEKYIKLYNSDGTEIDEKGKVTDVASLGEVEDWSDLNNVTSFPVIKTESGNSTFGRISMSVLLSYFTTLRSNINSWYSTAQSAWDTWFANTKTAWGDWVSARLSEWNTWWNVRKEEWNTWYGEVKSDWDDWFSDTLATGVRKIWSDWFSSAQQNVNTAISNAQTATSNANTQADAARQAAADKTLPQLVNIANSTADASELFVTILDTVLKKMTPEQALQLMISKLNPSDFISTDYILGTDKNFNKKLGSLSSLAQVASEAIECSKTLGISKGYTMIGTVDNNDSAVISITGVSYNCQIAAIFIKMKGSSWRGYGQATIPVKYIDKVLYVGKHAGSYMYIKARLLSGWFSFTDDTTLYAPDDTYTDVTLI